MTSSRNRLMGLGLAASLVATGLLASVPAQAAKPDNRGTESLQLLSFNDYHGHLEATDGPLDSEGSGRDAGGAEYLSAQLDLLRKRAGSRTSLTVAAGDLIGGSPFLSGLFHDEPSVESLNAMGLDVSSVGNHEFDEGTQELLRMQNGGCHPEDGCYFENDPYDGADFQWLAANVEKKNGTGTLLPGTSIKQVGTERVGFIGMTLEATPTLVSPAGVADVTFRDEVETANEQAEVLTAMGVEAIVVLLHEGGYQAGDYNDCEGISDPIATIATQMTADVDQIITGHTHEAYVCSIPDPEGDERLVTSAASYGQAVTESRLTIDRATGDVIRKRSRARNHLVRQNLRPDTEQTEIIAKWKSLSEVEGARVIGTVAEDITGDSQGDRGIETPMADLVADSILAATEGADEGGGQIAFQNVGGTRASLLYAPKYDEAPSDVTYQEAFDVLPFGNRIVTITMTGAQIEEALEQQYQPVEARGSRPTLALGVSEGFGYTWDDSQPQGSRVVEGSMTLNGEQMDLDATYRVSLYNFLQEGGDLFTAFTEGTELTGGPEDLPALEAYLGDNPDITAPESRIDGL